MIGKVVKMQGGVIMVYSQGNIHPCEIKGNVKKLNKVLVGDNVEIIKDEYSQNKYVITQVYPPKNSLLRPPLSNLDNLFILCAASPKPDFMLIDKLIIYCNINNIVPILVINKADITDAVTIEVIKNQYKEVVDNIVVVSSVTGEGINEIKKLLQNKTSAFTGQSAVGKSTLINTICPNLNLETNVLSRKTERGQHTTRHNEIFVLNDTSYLADTPGFSMLSLKGVNYLNLHEFYTEFSPYENDCLYRSCTHVNCPENVCGVTKALAENKINSNRYFRYTKLFLQLKQNEEWKYD